MKGSSFHNSANAIAFSAISGVPSQNFFFAITPSSSKIQLSTPQFAS